MTEVTLPTLWLPTKANSLHWGKALYSSREMPRVSRERRKIALIRQLSPLFPLLNSLFSPLKAAFVSLVFTARKKGHRFFFP